MEIKLQDSFKDEITGKALIEYVNRKYSCGYHDVTPEQFASVSSAVFHALESNEGLMSNMLGKVLDNVMGNFADTFEDDEKKYFDDLKDIDINLNVTTINKKYDIDKIYKEIDEILYTKTEPLRNIIRDYMKSYPFHGSSYIKLNGDNKEDTKIMFDYAMDCNDIYDKAYVMKSVADRVLEQYFNILKEINKEV